MPSGQVHAAFSVGLSAVCYGMVQALTGDSMLSLACGTGCVLGVALTPDLDQQTLSSSETTIIRYTLGLGFLWVMFWYPYALLIPHRSPLSHAPVIGTFGRLLYLSLLISIPAYLLGYRWQTPSPEIIQLLTYAITGLAISDTAHFICDVVWSRIRPRRSRLRLF